MNDPICRLCRRKLVSSSVPCSLVWYSFVKLDQDLLEIADTISCKGREGKCFWPYTCHGQEIVDGGVHRSIVCPQHRLYHLCVHVRKHHTEVCHGLIEKEQRNLIITVSVVVGTYVRPRTCEKSSWVAALPPDPGWPAWTGLCPDDILNSSVKVAVKWGMIVTGAT